MPGGPTAKRRIARGEVRAAEGAAPVRAEIVRHDPPARRSRRRRSAPRRWRHSPSRIRAGTIGSGAVHLRPITTVAIRVDTRPRHKEARPSPKGPRIGTGTSGGQIKGAGAAIVGGTRVAGRAARIAAKAVPISVLPAGRIDRVRHPRRFPTRHAPARLRYARLDSSNSCGRRAAAIFPPGPGRMLARPNRSVSLRTVVRRPARAHARLVHLLPTPRPETGHSVESQPGDVAFTWQTGNPLHG